jgi:aminoglycoside 6-adenylyltransferase
MNGKGMQTMRTSEEMFRLILDVAREDDRIRAVVLSGSRADPEVPRDRYQDYDILFLVREVAPFYNNTAWIETTFGRPAVMQMPEVMTHPLLPPDGDGHFTYLMLFEDGNRIDLSIDNRPYIDDGEPAVVLLDKDGLLPKLRPRKEYWHIQPPDRSVYRDCCNEFWWCLNNVAKGIARDELPYAMEMFQKYVRDMLNEMVRWAIGVRTGFTVSAGKCGKYFKRYLPESQYRLYAQTYASGDYTSLWAAVFTACELFRLTAGEVGAYFAFAYDEREDQNMTAYLLAVKTQWEQAGTP